MAAPAFLARPAPLRLWPRLPARAAAAARPARMLSQPRKKQPARCVDVFCARCRTRVYRYRKGGKGSLVKCWQERIAVDYTAERGVCPGCGAQFAKEAMVRGRPAFKIIGGRVYTR